MNNYIYIYYIYRNPAFWLVDVLVIYIAISLYRCRQEIKFGWVALISHGLFFCAAREVKISTLGFKPRGSSKRSERSGRLQTTKIDLIHFFYRYWHLGFVPLNVFQNKNTQTFCYKSLLSWFFVNVNATCIGKFYFKQIYRHCNATNAKTNDFRNLFQFYSYSGILLIDTPLTIWRPRPAIHQLHDSPFLLLDMWPKTPLGKMTVLLSASKEPNCIPSKVEIWTTNMWQTWKKKGV